MNGCMEKSDAMLSSPAWRFRMLHIAHRNARTRCWINTGCGTWTPFVLCLLEHCGGEEGALLCRRSSQNGSAHPRHRDRRPQRRLKSRAASSASRKERYAQKAHQGN